MAKKSTKKKTEYHYEKIIPIRRGTFDPSYYQLFLDTIVEMNNPDFPLLDYAEMHGFNRPSWEDGHFYEFSRYEGPIPWVADMLAFRTFLLTQNTSLEEKQRKKTLSYNNTDLNIIVSPWGSPPYHAAFIHIINLGVKLWVPIIPNDIVTDYGWMTGPFTVDYGFRPDREANGNFFTRCKFCVQDFSDFIAAFYGKFRGDPSIPDYYTFYIDVMQRFNDFFRNNLIGGFLL